MPVWRGALAVLALVAPLAAQADEVRVRLIAHGGVTVEAAAGHSSDAAHFCSAAADPWTAPDLPDPRGTPFPFYRLVFGQGAAGADLDAPGPSIGLALSNYAPDAGAHSDPVNDSIEVVLNGRHFVGHAGMKDAGYRFAVTFREDRRGGGFVARHLHETGTGHATIDLEGNWECPPVAAGLPAQDVSVHRLFLGAVPARPDPIPLRLSRTGIPCVDRGCAGWRVTDEDTGTAYLARVDLSRLRLAARLRRAAERGQIDLLVGADVRRGAPPRVIALELQGVEPPPPPPEDTPGPIPEAALH